MSEKNVTVGTGCYAHGNTKYKDSLFRFIFGKEENRAYLLNLYNALNGSSYDNPDELQITTLEDVVYISIKNDISFILDYVLVLYEHQSSYNPNMPLRGLLYMAQLYNSWIRQNEKNIYLSSLIKLPVPQYVVFYNGPENKRMKDKEYLRLSDAFVRPVRDGAYEWTAIMYNINAGHNEPLMNACSALREYSLFVKMVRDYNREHDLKTAIDKAIEDAIQQNFLNGFFKKYKEDVFMNVLTDFDIQLYEKGLREESLREGEIIGEKKGILGTIQILTRMSLPQNTIKTQIMEQYALSEDNATEYMHQAAAMIKK